MRGLFLIFTVLFLLQITACTYTERIRDGKTAFARKQFSVAIPMLEKEFAKAEDSNQKGAIAYMLGESYRRTQQPQAASDWYKRAQTQRYGKDTDLKHAQMLQQLEEYDAAKQAYRSAGRYAGNARLYQEQMIACDKAKRWKKDANNNPYKVTIESLNNNANDFSPVYYDNNNILVSSDRATSEGDDAYKWTGEPFFDLYLWNFEEETVTPFEAPFNNEFHQGTPSFNQERTIALFTECGSNEKIAVDYCRIMMSQKQGANWLPAQVIDLGDSDNNYLHPVLSPDGRRLYFACNKEGGFGGYDLYVSSRMGEGEDISWSSPINMGNKINTQGNEVFPFLTTEDTLYFASDGHQGMGGLDIFRAVEYGERWQQPQNLEAPMNSGSDDFGIIVQMTEAGEQKGFFTSRRFADQKGDNIFSFIYTPPKDTIPVIDTPLLILKIDLEGIVKEKIFNEPNNPNSGVDSLAALMGASIQISSADTAFTLGSDIDGTFYAVLDTNTVYYFKASKPGYFITLDTLSTVGIVLNEQHPDTTLSKELVLEKIFTDQEIVLDDIYYDLDKAFIREDAKPTLNKLVDLLKRNPSINIQLSSHTDCQGGTSYNEKLSQRRAESAVQYLIQNGIDPIRLTARGYGESALAVECRCSDCTDDEHQQNRRTTFLVLGE
jgi:outer membrane protein OmpA-like peptidoglycan-associated protein